MATLLACLCAVLVASGALRAQTAALSDDVLLLSRIRRAAISSLTTIPFYTCLETIERATRPSARHAYKPLDVVQLEVAEFGPRELFAWPGQKNFEDKDGQILGLSSNGEFFAHLQGIMTGSASIRYAGKEDCEGRPCVRYDFDQAQLFTHWTLANGGRSAIVAEKGSFWADPETANIYRLSVQAQDIPPNLGIRSAALEITYGTTALLSGHSSRNGFYFSDSHAFQLPDRFSLHMVLNLGEEHLNSAFFTHCREYHAESKILADTAPESSPEVPVEEIILPARLTVRMILSTPLKSGVNHVGDRIQAMVNQDVREKGRVMLPRGTQLIGRVRRLEHYTEPYEYWIAALEFTDAVFSSEAVSQHARFTAALQSYDPVVGLQQEIATERSNESLDLGAGVGLGGFRRIQREKLITRQLPGVGTFLSRGPTFSLSKGFHMTWVTTALTK